MDQKAFERLTSKFLVGDDHWEWQAGTNGVGYGRFYLKGRKQYAHRVLYELLVGPIPSGLVVDHVCGSRGCVNPAHLEPVSQQENIKRGTGPSASRARQLEKTHCPEGHSYSGDNLVVRARGSRECRECMRRRSREAYWRKKSP